MRKMIQLLAVAMVALLASFSVSADDSGWCGEHVRWRLYRPVKNVNSYTLEISGRGAMYDYDNWDNCAPWGTKEYIDLDLDITRIVVKNGVTSIGDYAFYRCYTVMSLTLPNTLKRIGRNAFYGCNSLKSLTLPRSLTSIGRSAFYLLYNPPIKTITVLSKYPPSCEGTTFSVYLYRVCKLNVPKGSEALYRKHRDWGHFYNFKAKRGSAGNGRRATRYRR